MEKINISLFSFLLSLIAFLAIGFGIGYYINKTKTTTIQLKYNEGKQEYIRNLPSDSIIIEFNRVFPTK